MQTLRTLLVPVLGGLAIVPPGLYKYVVLMNGSVRGPFSHSSDFLKPFKVGPLGAAFRSLKGPPNLKPMDSNLVEAMASNLEAMASNREAMASNQIVIASNLEAMAST